MVIKKEIELFRLSLRELKSEAVLTLLAVYDKRISMFCLCASSFRIQDNTPEASYDLAFVNKMKREIFKDGSRNTYHLGMHISILLAITHFTNCFMFPNLAGGVIPVTDVKQNFNECLERKYFTL